MKSQITYLDETTVRYSTRCIRSLLSFIVHIAFYKRSIDSRTLAHSTFSVASCHSRPRWASSQQSQVLLHRFSSLYLPSLHTQTRPIRYIRRNLALVSQWIYHWSCWWLHCWGSFTFCHRKRGGRLTRLLGFSITQEQSSILPYLYNHSLW